MANYILNGHEPVIEPDIMKWATWFETHSRKVANTEMKDVSVSTVFLGINHGYDGEILLFETMIFGGEHDGDQWRYSTWDEAVKGHQAACELVVS